MPETSSGNGLAKNKNKKKSNGAGTAEYPVQGRNVVAQAEEEEESEMAGTDEYPPKRSESSERKRLRRDFDEVRDKGTFLIKLVNYYAEIYTNKTKVGSDDTWIFTRVMRDMAEEVYNAKIKCEKYSDISTSVETDKQAKKWNRKSEEDIEAKLNKMLTEEELYELVVTKWGDQYFQNAKKMEKVEEDSAKDLVIVHNLRGEESRFLEGKQWLKEMLKGRNLKSGNLYFDSWNSDILIGPH